MTVGLELRFREGEVAPEPPDVEAFSRRSGARLLPPEDLGVLPGTHALEPRAPLVVFFQHASYGIPAFVAVPELAELASWSVRSTVFGWLASVPRERGGTARSKAAWVIAACLPLAFPAEVLAAAPAEKAAVQRPKTKLPAVPPTDASETAPAPAPSDTPTDSTAPEPTEPAEPTEGAAPAAEPEPAATDPFVPTGTSRLDRAALVDAAWEGVDGFVVELRLKGGREMVGRVSAVQRETFTLIEAGTGTVLVLPKSGVQSLRVKMPRPLPARTGAGLLAGGIILTTVGTPVFLTGLVFLALSPGYVYIHLPMLLTGGGALAGGIPMIVRGARNRRAYLEAVQERSLMPVISRAPGGWTGGIRFRF